jgi:outer membrane protein assembly factor BamB
MNTKTCCRFFCFMLLVAIVILVREPSAVGQQAPSAWPQFRGDAQLTGVASGTLPDKLALKWTYETGDIIESSAAIVDGTVYVGAGTGDLLAIDLETGKLRWKYSTGSQIGESSPAVGNGRVFVGDLAGIVHAVDAKSGTRAWTFKTGGEVKSSPVLVNGLVLVGSYDTHLYALQEKDGGVRWKLQTNGPVHATAAVQNGVIYLGGCDERFRAVRVADGKVLFELPLGGYTGASPAIGAERAFVGTFNQDVVAFDLRAKRALWRFRDPEREFPYYSSAALLRRGTDTIVVVGGRDKRVHAIDAKSGKAAWTFITRARVDSSPAIAGGRVYVGSSDGKLYALDGATGQKQWEFDAGDAITASPAIAGGRLVVGAQDGRIYCFG